MLLIKKLLKQPIPLQPVCIGEVQAMINIFEPVHSTLDIGFVLCNCPLIINLEIMISFSNSFPKVKYFYSGLLIVWSNFNRTIFQL